MFFIVTCIVCICVRRRRRLAQPQYMTIPAAHPTYGAVAQPYYTPSYMSQPGVNYIQGVPNMPPTAPAYQVMSIPDAQNSYYTTSYRSTNNTPVRNTHDITQH